MGRPLALIGGLLALAGAILGLFMSFGGWWILEMRIFNAESTAYFNAFWGSYDSISDETVYIAEEMVKAASGILVVLGGILCLFQKKSLAAIGGILILAGIGLWALNFADMSKDFFDFINLSGEVGFLEMFRGSREGPLGLIKVSWTIGPGLIMTLAGGILGLIGSAGRD